jgi:hypothetical protein
MRTDTNERAEVKELDGVAAEDLRGALLEMEAVAAGTRCTKPFYHASINTPAHERLTDEQRAYAIDRLAAELGLTGQARAVVVHEKEGREHCHIAWSRIDLDRMAAISDSHNFRKHEIVARELEREFGHERVQGAHVERDGKPRPERTPSHAEMLQADRTGMSPQEAKETITKLWRSTDSGQAFAAALEENGWVLARGDRRDYVVIDPMGGTHSLARRVEGMKAKDIRERMADMDSARLPNVAEAKQIQRARQERDGMRTRETPREVSIEASMVAPTPAPQADRGRTHGTPEGPYAESRAAEGAMKVIDGVASGIASVVESILGGEAHKPQTPEERATLARHQHEAFAGRAEAAGAKAEKIREQGGGPQEKRRQQLLREFGRETDDELRRDRDDAKERGRTR